MAVPITGTKLSDVKTNIEGGGGGTVTSLRDAIENEAVVNGYNPTYVVGGYDSLRDFRDYDHVVIPLTPTGLAESSDEDTTITMTWNSSVGALYYRIRKAGSTVYSLGNVLTYQAIGLICDATSYNFEVAASSDNISWSSYSSVVPMDTAPDTTPPPVPGAITITNITTSTYTINWGGVTDTCSGEVGNIYGGYEIHKDGILFDNIGQTSYARTSISAGESGLFKVQSYDANINRSAFTSEVCGGTLCTAPALVLSSFNTTSITLGWLPSTGASSYTLYWRQTNGSNYIAITNVTSPYTKTGLVSGVSYDFYVVAINACGNASANSNVITQITTDNVPPSNVTGLVATGGDVSAISVSWNAATDNVGVDHYILWRNHNGGSYIILDSNVSGTFKSDGTIAELDDYCYMVKAVDAAGNQSANFSNIDCATTDNG
jgi:hypothetical protein